MPEPVYTLSMPQLERIARYLDRRFAVERYPDERGGVFRPSDRPVRRLGLALEPFPELPAWIRNRNLDAVFLHRPWSIAELPLPSDVGVLFYHLPFDEHLTLGWNPRLAAALGMRGMQPLGSKQGRTIGMIGDVAPCSIDELRHELGEVFGGLDAAAEGNGKVTRLAVVGAMTDSLVREAAERGADAYVTGQLRQPARWAVAETGIDVFAVGHLRSELWGLQCLAGILRERWTKLDVELAPRGRSSRSP